MVSQGIPETGDKFSLSLGFLLLRCKRKRMYGGFIFTFEKVDKYPGTPFYIEGAFEAA
jgi:hypothetical protein